MAASRAGLPFNNHRVESVLALYDANDNAPHGLAVGYDFVSNGHPVLFIGGFHIRPSWSSMALWVFSTVSTAAGSRLVTLVGRALTWEYAVSRCQM